VTANCRTLAVALSVTNANGEVVVVNSAGIGAATITQSVVITAIGVDASIFVTSGNALTINTAGNVTITGLDLDGGGTGGDGIQVQAVGFLRLANMQIQNFADAGIELGSGNLAVDDSRISDSLYGLYQTGGEAYVRNTEFDHNSFGALSSAGHMTIGDSSVHYCGGGFAAFGGTVALYNDRIIFNTNGITSEEDGTLYFANCFISGNTHSYYISGGTIASSSPGTNLITPGQLALGTLSTAVTPSDGRGAVAPESPVRRNINARRLIAVENGRGRSS
jgi:hypothetical protein